MAECQKKTTRTVEAVAGQVYHPERAPGALAIPVRKRTLQLVVCLQCGVGQDAGRWVGGWAGELGGGRGGICYCQQLATACFVYCERAECGVLLQGGDTNRRLSHQNQRLEAGEGVLASPVRWDGAFELVAIQVESDEGLQEVGRRARDLT